MGHSHHTPSSVRRELFFPFLFLSVQFSVFLYLFCFVFAEKPRNYPVTDLVVAGGDNSLLKKKKKKYWCVRDGDCPLLSNQWALIRRQDQTLNDLISGKRVEQASPLFLLPW